MEYEGDLSTIPQAQRAEAMQAVQSAISRRVFTFGVSEPVVETSGTDRLIVQLPGIKDINQAISVIGQTPFLEFREENANATPTTGANGQTSVSVNDEWKTTGLTGQDLSSAAVDFNQQTGAPEITLQFNSAGTKLFSDITSRNIGKPVAIFLDGSILSTPTVQSAITDGQAVITGQFTVQQAKDLATNLNSGALPVPIHLISQENVGATLGHESIQKSVIAGIIGLLLIIIFMIAYYRFPGLLAIFALAIYTLLIFAIFKLAFRLLP